MDMRAVLSWRKLSVFILGLFLASSILSGCGVQENASNTTRVQFNLVHGQKQKASFASSVLGVASVTLVITGEGITPIFIKTLDVASGSVTLDVNVPKKNGLVANITGLDVDDVVLFQGSTTLNLEDAVPGQVSVVTIPIKGSAVIGSTWDQMRWDRGKWDE